MYTHLVLDITAAPAQGQGASRAVPRRARRRVPLRCWRAAAARAWFGFGFGFGLGFGIGLEEALRAPLRPVC